jgi:hypothetical protein
MTFDFSLYFQVLFLIFFIGNWLSPHNFIFVSMGNACKNVPPGSIGGDISFA